MSAAREIDRICDEFEAAWQAGETPNVEQYAERIDAEHREALRAALMPLDLTYRGKLNVTMDLSEPSKGSASGFEVTLDSGAQGPELFASPTTRGAKQAGPRVKYFGEYELLSEIARGGMGVVYKARQVKLNRIVALKMILSGEFAGSEAVQRFHSEAESAANLDHPGIVPIYEIGEHEGQHYFSMGFIDGPSLQGKLAAGPMPAKEAARLCRKIAEAVAYAHSKCVIHRDLKPANVLIDGNGEPKVTDFGLAKKVEGDSGLTRTGAVMGTPSYMPPEQALGQTDKIGPAADVYSLGAILYCMLTGRPPFQAASVVDTLKQVLEQEPITPRTLDSKIPLDLETICLKCLEKNPTNRYASTQDFVDELNRFDKGDPIKSRRISRAARSVRWCKRNSVVATLGGAIVVLLLVGTFVSSAFAVRASREANRATSEANKATNEKYRADEKAAEAIAAAKEADHQTRMASRHLYSAHMNLAQNNWEGNLPVGTLDLLKRYDSGTGNEHLRGFEWHYWDRLCHSDLRTMKGHKSWISSVAFSPDGTQIASAGDVVKLWNAAKGEETATLNGHTSAVTCIAFSPDGRRLASGSWDKSVKLWDVATGNELAMLKEINDAVMCVAFSPEGAKIASAYGNTVKFWDSSTGQELMTLTGHNSRVNNISFSPDGKSIASANDDHSVRVWDTTTGEEINTFIGHTDPVSSVAFSPDSTKIVSASKDRTVRLWDLVTGDQIVTLNGHTNWVSSVAFCPDGKHIASGSRDWTVKLWNLETNRNTVTYKGHTGEVGCVAFSPDGSRIASGSAKIGHDLFGAGEDHSVTLWDATTGHECSVIHGHKSVVSCVEFSPDCAMIASAGGDKVIKLWDATLQQETATLNGHTDFIYDVSFSPNGAMIASASGDKTVKLWDTTSGQELLTLPEHSSAVRSVAFSPDGKRIASTDRLTVTIWTTESGEPSVTLKGHSKQVHSVAFSPDGKQIATASEDNTIRLWDAYSGQETASLEGVNMELIGDYVTDWSFRVAFSPDGTRIISTNNRNLILWDTADAKELLMLSGHTGAISNVAFNFDGTRIVSASNDNTIKLWDAITGQETTTLKGHTDSVRDVAFSTDGQWVVSASADRTLRLWDATPWTPPRQIESEAQSRIRSLRQREKPIGDWRLTLLSDKTISDLVRDQALPIVDVQVHRLEKADEAHKRLVMTPDGHCGLLKSLDVDASWTNGQWRSDSAKLEAVEKESVIEFPYSPPAEYRMTAVVEPLDEPAALLLRQQMDGHPFLVTLAYNGQNSLELVDGVNVPNETTHRGQLFRKGELSEIVVTVKKSVVQVSVDGKQIIDWKGDASRLSLNHHTPNLEVLAVHVGGCRYRFHRLSIEPLSGKGRVLTSEAVEDVFGEPATK